MTQKLDLSILQIPLIQEPHYPMGEKHPFWKKAFHDELPITQRNSINKTNIENPICYDQIAFLKEILVRNAKTNKLLNEHRKKKDANIPVEVSSNLEECSPQFILRNIPKYEKSCDLSQRLYFDFEEPPRNDAERIIDAVRTFDIEPINFLPCDSTKIVDDFRVFLEEIFTLCPWDKIKRGSPPEDSLWNPKHSMSKFTHDLLEQRYKLFAVSDEKTSFIQFNKTHTPKKTQNITESNQTKESPFGPSYGPPAD